MLNFEQFCNYIKDNISKYLVDVDIDYIRLTKMQKTAKLYTALNIIKKDSHISVNLYLNDFYEEYSHRNRKIDEIVKSLAETYAVNQTPPELDTTIFTGFEKCKHRIVARFISCNDLYMPYLNSRVFAKYGNEWSDIVTIFDIDLSDINFLNQQPCDANTSEDSVAMQIPITPELLAKWNEKVEVSVNDLIEIAKINTPKLRPALILNMENLFLHNPLIYNNKSLNYEQKSDDELRSEKPIMLIISNSTQHYGANAILYPTVYERIKYILNTDDIYIIPSSIHEMIAIPASVCMDIEELYKMNSDVNAEQVSSDEFLSDDVYIINANNELESVAYKYKFSDDYNFQDDQPDYPPFD